MPLGTCPRKVTAFHTYVIPSMVCRLPILVRNCIKAAKRRLSRIDPDFSHNLVKFRSRSGETWPVSFLQYLGFGTMAHPMLWKSYTVHENGRVTARVYQTNQPVLHRSELLFPVGHPLREGYEKLTAAEEKAGLLDKPPGRLKPWCDRLKTKGYTTIGVDLVPLAGRNKKKEKK